MRSILFIAEWNMSSCDGITTKIEAQLASLRGGNNVDCLCIEKEEAFFNKEKTRYKLICLYKTLFFKSYDVIYIRNITSIYSIILAFFLFFLKGKEIYIEIPTYPYDSEGGKSFIKRVFNSIVRKMYSYSVSNIAYMGEETDKIWGIEAVKIDNGITVDDFKLKSIDDTVEYSGIKFISVSSLAYWHGVDRFLYALSEFEGDYEFHVVGDGPEMNEIKTLTEALGLTKKVIFHGFKSGKELDDLFEICNIAVDSLGRHRSGNNENNSLKAREYTARGIPFIKSHSDPAFNDVPFCFNVPPNDHDIINIYQIHEWYTSMNLTPTEIRCFAKENLSWTKQFSKLGIV